MVVIRLRQSAAIIPIGAQQRSMHTEKCIVLPFVEDPLALREKQKQCSQMYAELEEHGQLIKKGREKAVEALDALVLISGSEAASQSSPLWRAAGSLLEALEQDAHPNTASMQAPSDPNCLQAHLFVLSERLYFSSLMVNSMQTLLEAAASSLLGAIKKAQKGASFEPELRDAFFKINFFLRRKC